MSYQPQVGDRVTWTCQGFTGTVQELQRDGKTAFVAVDGRKGRYICQSSSLSPIGSQVDHRWRVVDQNSQRVRRHCPDCNATRDTATPQRHLNNAIAAAYANVGPSAVLVDIRAAMEENSSTWTHWSANGEREWTL